MCGFGAQELLIIFLIILLLFGAGRIPKIGRAFGRGIANFRRAMRDKDEDSKRNDGR